MDLSIIIVSFNTKNLLLDCIQSIQKYTKGVSYEIVVVDNASIDGSVEAVDETSGVKVIRNKKNEGFARANNQGTERALGRYILFLNSDTKLQEDSLTRMVSFMDKNNQAGVVSCKLLNSDGSTQASGGNFPTLLRIFLWATFLDDIPFVSRSLGAYHLHAGASFMAKSDDWEHQQDWVSGAVFLVRAEIVKSIGGFNEDFFMYGEDVEYCFRIKKAGWGIWYIPQTSILHIGSASSGGRAIQFSGKSLGKEKGILGEFEGLKKFYKEHYSPWQYLMLMLLLKKAAFLRMIVFGILGRQPQALKTYAKAFATF